LALLFLKGAIVVAAAGHARAKAALRFRALLMLCNRENHLY
jgi:hypothetical protein